MIQEWERWSLEAIALKGEATPEYRNEGEVDTHGDTLYGQK